MEIQPYLFFGGRCAEALKFYQKALNAQITFQAKFKDAPPDASGPVPAEIADKIMHATLKVGNSIFMCSDGDCRAEVQQQGGYALSLNPDTLKEARHLFHKLAEEGTVTMKFEKTFWALGFGMVRDKFGIQWMVNVENPAMKKSDFASHSSPSK